MSISHPGHTSGSVRARDGGRTRRRARYSAGAPSLLSDPYHASRYAPACIIPSGSQCAPGAAAHLRTLASSISKHGHLLSNRRGRASLLPGVRMGDGWPAAPWAPLPKVPPPDDHPEALPPCPSTKRNSVYAPGGFNGLGRRTHAEKLCFMIRRTAVGGAGRELDGNCHRTRYVLVE